MLWYRLPNTCLAVAILAGATSLCADEPTSEEVETSVLDAEEAVRIAAGWVGRVVATGDRSISLIGDRDQVQQAIGAVMLADRRAAENRGSKDEKSQLVTRVFRVEHTDPRVLAALIKRSVPDVQADLTLQVVVLHGFQEQVEKAVAVLAELDIPRDVPVARDVVFDVYLIGAYLDANEFPPMPAVPQRAVDGLRETFAFASYRLLEAFLIRASPGGNDAKVKGYLDSEQLVEYNFEVAVEGGQTTPDLIGLSEVLLVFRVFHQEDIQESEIWTSLTTRESKIVVVGKAGVRGVADGVFLVLKARFE